jgi:hypothetical protein
MLITLAWLLPLKLSVTLSALLSVILLLLALQESKACLVITLVSIPLIWRGEAWKAVFLESKRQVSELQQQQQIPISSNIGFCCPDQSIGDGALIRSHGVFDRILPAPEIPYADAVFLSLPVRHECRSQMVASGQNLLNPYRSSFGNPASQTFGRILSKRPLEKPYRSWPNTSELYMTYIV